MDATMQSEAVEQQEGKGILKKFENDIIKWVVGCALAILGTGVTFYFTAKGTLEVHGEKIDKLDVRVKAIEENGAALAIEPAVNSEQINSTKAIVEDVQQRIRRVEERQDKIYDILIEMKKDKK